MVKYRKNRQVMEQLIEDCKLAIMEAITENEACCLDNIQDVEQFMTTVEEKLKETFRVK